jgi:transposase
MAHLVGEDRRQTLLLPEALDDYVGAENPVRFIDAFVDGLELTTAGFGRVHPQETGRPGYAPADLLKLYIYGYLNRIRSSRRLESETHRNVEVIWLLRHLKPDFKTIADFRRDNRDAFRAVFRQFVLLCREMDLFGRELLAVDGTRIKAVNNKDRNFTRASLQNFIELADAKLGDYLQRLDQSDACESKTGGSRVKDLAEKIAAIRERRTRCKDMLAQLDRTGKDQISLTDPDSRAMAAHTRVGVGYNVQVAVDTKHKLIVEQQVTNQVLDMGLLTQTAEAAKEILGVETIEAVDNCKIRLQCTGGKFRTVSRLENEAVLDRMQARLAQRPHVLALRRETVEHPFGSIKQWMNQGAFLMRGLEKVRGEFSLTALAYNLRRVLNIVGFTELMAAVAA